jgi:hypothetical protein
MIQSLATDPVKLRSTTNERPFIPLAIATSESRRSIGRITWHSLSSDGSWPFIASVHHDSLLIHFPALLIEPEK